MTNTNINTPELWKHALPTLAYDTHKYKRGQVFSLGGDEAVGAAKLSALAALRTGCGLSHIICSHKAFPIYAANTLSVMVKPWREAPHHISEQLSHHDKQCWVLGPGSGIDDNTRACCKLVISHQPCIVDADAISAYEDKPEQLFSLIQGSTQPVILTPHDSEFERLFGFSASNIEKERINAAREAAAKSGAIILLKGPRTILSTRDVTVIQEDAPATLATAGSGDVLAGVIASLIAQGTLAFEATCAAVWLHAKAAKLYGNGLISSDLPDYIPLAYATLLDA